MTIEEIGKQDKETQEVSLNDILTTFEVAIIEQGKELTELKQRIGLLEYSLKKHANNTDNAHKI